MAKRPSSHTHLSLSLVLSPLSGKKSRFRFPFLLVKNSKGKGEDSKAFPNKEAAQILIACVRAWLCLLVLFGEVVARCSHMASILYCTNEKQAVYLSALSLRHGSVVQYHHYRYTSTWYSSFCLWTRVKIVCIVHARASEWLVNTGALPGRYEQKMCSS
jgi:hypothetical protein